MRQADVQFAAGAHTDRHGRTRLEFRCGTVTLCIACSVLVPGFESCHLLNCITHFFVLVLLNVEIWHFVGMVWYDISLSYMSAN